MNVTAGGSVSDSVNYGETRWSVESVERQKQHLSDGECGRMRRTLF